MFCVECGKEGKTYNGLCADCYLSRGSFVNLPKTLDVPVCGECLSVRIGKKWHNALTLEEAVQLSIEKAIEKSREVDGLSISVNLIEHDPRNYLATTDVKFTVGDLSAERRCQIEVRLKKETCNRCGRRAGHYYEAIIQIRGSERSSRQEVLERARELVHSRVEAISHKSRDIFISKEERQHGGYDIYLSSGSVAKMIARELTKMHGASSKSSASVAGMRDGKELRRMTYLVRLPGYEMGDVLLFDNCAYLLRSVSENQLSLVDLQTWQEINISRKRLPAMEILPREAHVKEATIVSESDRELQILDSETLNTVEVRKPSGFRSTGSTVQAVKTNIGIFLLPPY